MQHDTPWLDDVLRGVAHRTPTLVEVADSAGLWLTVTAIVAASKSTWLIVPDREVEGTLRALAEHLPDASASASGADAVSVMAESWFFELVGTRWLTATAETLPCTMVVLRGDGFVERAREALTRTVRDRHLAHDVRRRVRLGRLIGCTAVLPEAVVQDLLARGGVPIVNDAPNWVAFLEQEVGGTALKSRPIDVGPMLRHTFGDRAVVVLGHSLSVGGSLRFAAGELGMADPVEVFEDPTGWQDLTLFTPPMPETSSMGWPYAVAEAAWMAIRSREGRALVFGSSMNREALRRRIRRPLRLMGEGGTGVTFATPRDLDDLETFPLVVVDRLSFPSPLQPVEGALRRRNVRWFEGRALPKAVQTFRRMASRVEPGGTLVVLDHRVRSRGYGHRFTGALSGVHVTEWEGFLPTWGDALPGGAG